jgi:exodeoxyribonuclease V beta subunit
VEAPVRFWERTDSFSALIKKQRALEPGDTEGRDHDEEVDPGRSSEEAAPVRERIALDGFARGRRVGDMFHEILERLDFQKATDAELVALGRQKLEALGELRDLDAAAQARQSELLALAVGRRISELEFRIPVAATEPNALRLSRSRLARVFREHPSRELASGYAGVVETLDFLPLAGYLKGFIDLVFEHDGRVYVVDYKTNHLGDHYDDYDAAALREAMSHSHYYLQYHLYALAVHRLLQRQKPGYRYEEHFGGVVYLFVRGLRPGGRGHEGVFFERPPIARMNALSAVFDGASS